MGFWKGFKDGIIDMLTPPIKVCEDKEFMGRVIGTLLVMVIVIGSVITIIINL